MVDRQHYRHERAESARPPDRPARPAQPAGQAPARRQLNLRMLMPTFLDDPLLWHCPAPAAGPARRTE